MNLDLRLTWPELLDKPVELPERRHHFVVYMDTKSAEPTQELSGRETLAPVFDNLNQYAATTHFNGQSTVVVDGNQASGESYTIAHHVTIDDDRRTLMIASIRYLDQFVKLDGTWFFAERRLLVDWTETRPTHD